MKKRETVRLYGHEARSTELGRSVADHILFKTIMKANEMGQQGIKIEAVINEHCPQWGGPVVHLCYEDGKTEEEVHQCPETVGSAMRGML